MKYREDESDLRINIDLFISASSCTVMKCMGCKADGYCSKTCQKKAWKLVHKYECPNLKDIDVNKTMRFLGKVLIFLKVVLYKIYCYRWW